MLNQLEGHFGGEMSSVLFTHIEASPLVRLAMEDRFCFGKISGSKVKIYVMFTPGSSLMLWMRTLPCNPSSLRPHWDQSLLCLYQIKHSKSYSKFSLSPLISSYRMRIRT